MERENAVTTYAINELSAIFGIINPAKEYP